MLYLNRQNAHCVRPQSLHSSSPLGATQSMVTELQECPSNPFGALPSCCHTGRVIMSPVSLCLAAQGVSRDAAWQAIRALAATSLIVVSHQQ